MPQQVVVIKGPLKKRGATMPVMRDRYCVATWEPLTDSDTAAAGIPRKTVVLRTYKTADAYTQHPQKPLDEHTLKCVSEWDGRGNFHKYPHGFMIETSDHKLLLCAAPSGEAKAKWLELMDAVLDEPQGPTTDDGGSTSSGQQHKRVANSNGVLFASDDEDVGDDDEEEEDAEYGKAAAVARSHARPYELEDLPHAENDLLSDDDFEDDGGFDSDDNRRSRVQPVSPLALSPVDDKLLFRAGSSESLTSSFGKRADAEEPDDWGMYGAADGHGPSRYDVVDGPVLSLDTDLLNGGPKAAAPLASDEFLFEQNGPTFGAVVVPAASGGDGGDDFVDPVLQERRERKKKEKQLKRVTKKLESNRDLYAEMAAARLKSMRKDAKTKPRPSVTHRRRGDDDEDDDDDWSDNETVDDERSRAVSTTESAKTSISKTSTPKSRTPEETPAPFELEEIESEDEPFIPPLSVDEKPKKKKSKKRDEVAVELTVEPVEDAPRADAVVGDDDFLFGEASMPALEVVEHESTPQAVQEEEVDEEEARRRRREKRRLKRLQQEEEAARLEEIERERQASVSSNPLPEEPVRRSSMDDQWQRTAESQKRKEERRRARKEKARREAEAAAAAEEQARQHREEMKRLEEEELKQERRERKERKKLKEKSALDKKARELKKKEAALLAEAEKLKQTQEALKADEIKDVSRKTKRRDKYTSPADRIQRREKEVEAATVNSNDMSTALVVVENPPASAPAMVSSATETEPTAAPATAVSTATAPVSAPVTVPPAAPVASETISPPLSAPSATPLPAAETVASPAPQTAPTAYSPNGLQQPAMFPAGYPASTPTPFPMAMPYAAPYPGVHYTPGFAPVPYGPGMAMPTPYYPHLGYVGGIAPMSAPAQMQAYAMMHPPSSSTASMASAAEEEPFIGPQLPSPKGFAANHGPAPAPPPAVPTAPVSNKAPSSAMLLPDLPDVVGF